VNEEFGYEEYQGNIGDRYVDNEGNEFVVSAKVKGGVDLRGQGGTTTRATSDLKHMKKINKPNVNNINEQQIKLARQALNKRGINEGMSKKEAIQILIKHNIK
jgi:hypothetical protein